jgi:hypothetical protein
VWASETVREQIKQTTIDKYGIEYPQQLDVIKEQTKQTNLDKYGTKTPQQLDTRKDKVKQTNIERYGVEFPNQSDEVKNKATGTNHNLYDRDSHSQIHITKKSLKNLNDRTWMYDNHVIQQKPFAQIGDELNCTISTISRYMKNHEIETQHFFQSIGEKELSNFVSSLGIKTSTNIRSIIPPHELDIYIPEYKIAIEYNGLYWHSEKNKKQSDYHLNKTISCEQQGIRLIHIFEDEWKYQQQKCKDTILHLLGQSKKGVYARNASIQEISWKEAKDFLNKYHLLNAGTSGNYRIGAFNKDNELVGVMVFGQQNNEKSKKGTIELKRFVTDKRNNPGLGSKMFNFAIKQKHYSEVIAFVDRRWFTGLVKTFIGFTLVDTTSPAIWWTDGGKRYYRRFITKQQLIKEGFNPTLSKKLILESLGYYRIWDCGKLKLRWVK